MKFAEKVYMVVSSIPRGTVSTYKVVGKKIGSQAYRAVGMALRANPDVSEMQRISKHDQKSPISDTPRVPCHRVVASDGSLGGYCGKMDNPKKIALLKQEGVAVISGKIVDFEKKLWK